MTDNSLELLNTEIKNSVYNYINWDTIERPCENFFIANNLAPKREFYWKEEDYQGSIFAIYEYKFKNKTYYFCIKSGFGSCSGCDGWLRARECNFLTEYTIDSSYAERYEYIKKEFNNFYIEHDKNTILHNLGDYVHPKLKTALKQWSE